MKEIQVAVLMSSGDEDVWFDLQGFERPVTGRVVVSEQGMLTIIGPDESIQAMYAPGMWMRVEFREKAPDAG